MDSPYRSPNLPAKSQPLNQSQRSAAPKLMFTLPVTTLIGSAFGFFATIIVWTTQHVNPMDRWPVFWWYLLFGAVAGFIGGIIWIVGLRVRNLFTRPPTF